MRRKSRATRLSYALAAIVLLCGIVLSLRTGAWNWLSRSGSLIVVIGIILTSTQIIENNRLVRHRRHQWETTQRASRDWAADSEQLRVSRSHDEHLFENERSGLYMLVAGTLIWGFGDLVGFLF